MTMQSKQSNYNAFLKIQLTLSLFVFIDFNHLAYTLLCAYTAQYKGAGH